MSFLHLLPVYQPNFTTPQLKNFMLDICALADQD
jgi:hypothetical protein